MEVESTGDLVSKINDINEMGLCLDDVDLAEVDKELELQEREAKKRYVNFDSELTFNKEQDGTIPEG